MNVLERKKNKFRSFRVLQFQLLDVEELTFLKILIILKKKRKEIPTIVVLGPKVESNLVSIVQFFVLIPNLAFDMPYVAYFGGKSIPRQNRLRWANLMPDSESAEKLDYRVYIALNF